MGPLVLALLGGTAYALYEKRRNPSWTPFSTLFATPRQLRDALMRVRMTSVPTPTETAALDPGMSTEQVKAVNAVITTEIDPAKIAAHASAHAAVGNENTAKALAAKAEAVGAAKAAGATDADVHKEQIAAISAPVSASAPAAASIQAEVEAWIDNGVATPEVVTGWSGWGGSGGWGGGHFGHPHHYHHPHYDPYLAWQLAQAAQYGDDGWDGGGWGESYPYGNIPVSSIPAGSPYGGGGLVAEFHTPGAPYAPTGSWRR